ncbi:MAG: DUF1064 domain-containing protein [Proteobacteria bacterium]|nr:DUF1064 domain-containing protein [Pseudomonadota bacterium]
MRFERMTAAEFREERAADEAKRKRNKFGARKTTVDGITFDSKAEATRWAVLKLQERLGLISNLRRQVWHSLQAANGAVACRYRADFDYVDADGNPVTEDSKGYVTRDFKIKAKLFKEQYGREIRVIKT